MTKETGAGFKGAIEIVGYAFVLLFIVAVGPMAWLPVAMMRDERQKKEYYDWRKDMVFFIMIVIAVAAWWGLLWVLFPKLFP